MNFVRSNSSENAAASPVELDEQALWSPHTPLGIGDKRHFLIISAPFGPFSKELSANLRAAGADVTRILLNAGDVLSWGLRNAEPYFGTTADWADWLKAFVQRKRFTDIITYGDSSPHAAAALAVSAELGLRRHVLEQGYFRPDWVTLEAEGVNANSDLPRDPDWYRNHPAAKQPAASEAVGRTTPAAVWHIFNYHLAMYIGAPIFFRYRAHYRDSAVKQAMGHVARYGQELVTQTRHKIAYENLVSTEGSVFLCILQRPGDSQLWRHSEYESPSDFIRHVVASFAAHAPANARLLVRLHPLDPGIFPYDSFITAVAAEFGVQERVCVSNHGKLHDVLPQMAGVICINSTAGLAAVEFGKPTIALGRAMYDVPGLIHQGGLEKFWTAPEMPDAALYQAFRRVVMSETQINGAYATANGRRLAVPEIARRLLADRL